MAGSLAPRHPAAALNFLTYDTQGNQNYIFHLSVCSFWGKPPSTVRRSPPVFQKLMKKGFVQGGEQVMHTKLLAGFSGTAVAERWLHNLTPPPEKETSKRTAENEKDEDEVLPEDFNPADRDSVLRILQ